MSEQLQVPIINNTSNMINKATHFVDSNIVGNSYFMYFVYFIACLTIMSFIFILYSNKMSIIVESMVPRSELDEKVIKRIKKQNETYDKSIMMDTYKKKYDKLIISLEELTNNKMLDIIINLEDGELKSDKMRQFNELHNFKKSLIELSDSI